MDIKSFLTDQRLTALFNEFDINNSGFISKRNFQEAMQRLGGPEIDRIDLESMMIRHDQNEDGRINFDEFKDLFLNSRRSL